MNPDASVGSRLRELRKERDLSQRELAELASLSPNAISLIERHSISPSVATLQRLATALKVRMGFFFESSTETKVIHAHPGNRPEISSHGVAIAGLGAHLATQQMEPFVITLAPLADAGRDEVVHTGHELVHCLSGIVQYEIDGEPYTLTPGDQLLFRADLPHRWRNPGPGDAQFLLVLQSPDGPGDPTRRHFSVLPSVTHLA